MLGTVFLVALIVALFGALPAWPQLGYGPTGVLGSVVIILTVLVFIGSLRSHLQARLAWTARLKPEFTRLNKRCNILAYRSLLKCLVYSVFISPIHAKDEDHVCKMS
jgi:hypothetical protein